MSNLQRCLNLSATRPLVKMSAFWIVVLIGLIRIPFLLPTLVSKKWYFMAICLVRGVIFGNVVRVNAPLLSSNMVDLTMADLSANPSLSVDPTFFNNLHNGRSSCIAWDSAIYLALVVNKVTLVCSLETQRRGVLLKVSTYPVLDLMHIGSWISSILYRPAKSALT